MQGNMDMHLIWNITLSKVYIHDIVITTKITKYIIRRKKLSKFVTNEDKQTLNLCVFDFQLVPQKSTWLNIQVNSFFILTLHTLISFIHFKPTIIHKTFTQHTEHFLVNKAINCVYCDKCRKDMNECKRCIWPFRLYVFLTKIQSKPVKYTSSTIKVFILTQTISTLSLTIQAIWLSRHEKI